MNVVTDIHFNRLFAHYFMVLVVGLLLGVKDCKNII